MAVTSTSRPRSEPLTSASKSRSTSGAPESGAPESGERRISNFLRPSALAPHAVALLVLLTALLGFVTTDAVWTSDEGALLYQAEHVASGQGWEVPHPFAEADPAGTQFPIELTIRGADGDYLPYSRHAPLVWIVGYIYLLFGYAGVVMLSVLGTVGAALAAGKLGQRIDNNPDTRARTGVAALWCTGLGSPMLFNSYIAWAHTLVAALICWAFYVLATTFDAQPGSETTKARSRTSASKPVSIAVAMGLIGFSCLLRTEAVLAGVAIGLAFVGLHTATKTSGWPIGGIAAIVAAVIGFVADKALNPATGELVKDANFDELYGLVDGRLAGLYQTWLRPTTDTGIVSMLFLLGAMLMVASGFLARQYRPSARSTDDQEKPQSGGPTLFAAIGMGLILSGAVMLCFNGSDQINLPSVLVPGLLVAFPSLFAGLLLTGRDDLKNPVLAAAVATCGLFWLAVLATQYRFGGGAEWGGRYFSAALPLAIPVAVANCQKIVQRRTSAAPVVLVGVLIASQLTFGVLSLSRIRSSRSELAYLDNQVTETKNFLGADQGAKNKPVFITTIPPAGRWMWQHLDDSRWLWVENEELPETMDRLADLGINRVALVTLDQDNDLPLTNGRYEPLAEADLSEPVIVLESTRAP